MRWRRDPGRRAERKGSDQGTLGALVLGRRRAFAWLSGESVELKSMEMPGPFLLFQNDSKGSRLNTTPTQTEENEKHKDHFLYVSHILNGLLCSSPEQRCSWQASIKKKYRIASNWVMTLYLPC